VGVIFFVFHQDVSWAQVIGTDCLLAFNHACRCG